MSRILDEVNKLRQDLDAQDKIALQSLVSVYQSTWLRLQKMIDDIIMQINLARQTGKIPVQRVPGSLEKLASDEFSINWLGRLERYKELMIQCEVELAQIALISKDTVELQQIQMLQMGIDKAKKLIETSLGAMPSELVRQGVYVSWNYISPQDLISMVGFLSDGSPLAYKFADMSDKVKEGIKNALVTGIALGENPRVINRNIRKEFGGALLNSLTTCRTEALRAYRFASHETYKKNAHLLQGWIRVCARQTRTCAACWAVDGSFHLVEEPLYDHPNGRCVAVPVTKSWEELFPSKGAKSNVSGIQPWDPETYFSKLSPTQQRQVLGSRKYELYRAGQIKLEDIPVLRKSKDWGDYYVPGNLQQVQENALKRVS